MMMTSTLSLFLPLSQQHRKDPGVEHHIALQRYLACRETMVTASEMDGFIVGGILSSRGSRDGDGFPCQSLVRSPFHSRPRLPDRSPSLPSTSGRSISLVPAPAIFSCRLHRLHRVANADLGHAAVRCHRQNSPAINSRSLHGNPWFNLGQKEALRHPRKSCQGHILSESQTFLAPITIYCIFFSLFHASWSVCGAEEEEQSSKEGSKERSNERPWDKYLLENRNNWLQESAKGEISNPFMRHDSMIHHFPDRSF